MANKPVKYIFKVNNTSPEAMPLADLAELLGKLASVFGDGEHVHAVEIRKGSLCVVHQVSAEANAFIKQRLASLGGKKPVQVEIKAVDEVNRFLAKKGLNAELTRGRFKVLQFPGVMPPEIGPIEQEYAIQGEIIRIGGKDESVHVHLRDHAGNVQNCTCNRKMAKELRGLLFEGPVRLIGKARLFRGQGQHGKWRLDHFRILKFERLSDLPIDQVFAKAREAVAKARQIGKPPNGEPTQ